MDSMAGTLPPGNEGQGSILGVVVRADANLLRYGAEAAQPVRFTILTRLHVCRCQTTPRAAAATASTAP